jgi:4-phytase/acid phosphatase
MNHSSCGKVISLAFCILFCAACPLRAQGPKADPEKNATLTADELRFVVIVSRHGVRSPTGKLDGLNHYSNQPWPVWSVPPGYLTEHGAQLMTMMGAYDRALLADEGLLTQHGCEDAAHIRIRADSDQRTRETGRALAAGLAPGCNLAVIALPEGTADPLFHSVAAGVGSPDRKLAASAVSGRIGGNPQGITEAYRPQFNALEEILHSCSPGADCKEGALPSLFDIPASIAPGKGDHLIELKTPLGLASTMTENLLLEYADGMDTKNVGWGRVDAAKLGELLQLHVASEDISQRTEYIARAQSSNLLFHALQSITQSAEGHAVTGSLIQPDDRLLLLVGHDTNIANIAGALGLSWLVDGRRDDTPPGGALVFELWKKAGSGEYSVRTFYVAQTLDQMRNRTPLTLNAPPQRVPVFVPGCGRADGACDWSSFQKAIKAAIDPAFIK